MAEAVLLDSGTAAVSCPDCGLLQRIPGRVWQVSVSCGRCGAFFFRRRVEGLDQSLSLMLAVAVLFGIALAQPFLTFSLRGQSQSCTLLSGIAGLWEAGAWALAIVVFLTIILAPLLRILGLLYVLGSLRLGWKGGALGPIFRRVEQVRPWAMLDVLMLAVLVAGVKMRELADVTLEPGVQAFIPLVFLWAAARDRIDTTLVWEMIEPQQVGPAEAGLACLDCGNRVARLPGHERVRCPRCHATLRSRKPESLSRTAAFILAAALLYVPANLFPILSFTSLGRVETQTILGSVDLLFSGGMWPIGLILFFASIVVPLLKIAGLSWLAVAVRTGSIRPAEETRLYRVIEYIGRWSMVDVFVLTLLVALVQLGNVATIVPGIGATCFAAVVILTIFGARSFDPRLIWDRRRNS